MTSAPNSTLPARGKSLACVVRAVQFRAARAQAPGSADDPFDFRPILVMGGDIEILADAGSF